MAYGFHNSDKDFHSMKARYWATALLALAASVCFSQQAKPEHKARTVPAAGKQLFASSCAACHGIDGKGSERAPNIADGANVRRMSHAQIFAAIQNGIPGTGMPAFHTLSATQIDTLIAHLRTLAGNSKPQQLPGDPGAGKALFSGNAGCSQCHMLAGDGGFIASDLSDYARGHSAEQIRSAIVNPGASPGGSVKIATLRLQSGQAYTGRVRNEDNFSIQLQDLEGSFHLLSRSEVAAVEYDSKSMMPSDYGSRLTSKELDDLVSYLISASEGLRKAKSDKMNEADCSPDCTDSDE